VYTSDRAVGAGLMISGSAKWLTNIDPACAPNSTSTRRSAQCLSLRRKRVGCCRRLGSTRINHEIASCFNTGCEYKNGYFNHSWFQFVSTRNMVESTTVDSWMKQLAFISSWSLVETSLIYLRWLIQLWLFQHGVRVEFWLNQPRLISGWNNLLSSLVDLWLKQA